MPSYRQLIDDTFRGFSEAPPPDLPDELELQALWFAGAFGRDFTTTDGAPAHIVQFGEWNRSSGPDFLHTVVEIDGVPHHGPLEIDTSPEDWEQHGHGADPAFEDTVLHLVFRDPPKTTFTRTHQHRQVPVARIPDALIREALQLPSRQTAIARPGRCLTPLAELSHEAIAALLRQAAEHRAERKAARFLRTAEAHGRETSLFHAAATTLGYRGNSLPMRLLAQRLPLSFLRERPDELEAILLGCAGFLSADLHESAPADTRDHLRQLWHTWWRHRGDLESAHPLPWRTHGQRPANHPHRRVAALAALLREWPTFRRRALNRPFRHKPLLDCLTQLSDPFWNHRHTLTSAPSAKPVALFGKSRGIELLANHLAPLALTEDSNYTYEDYLGLPAANRNEHVRRCAIRLFGSEERAKPWLKKAAHHQALLQIYHDFCLEDRSDCEHCPFPEQLAHFAS